MQDLNVKISHVIADLGFQGVDADNPGKEIIHRGKFKTLRPQQRGWLRRRQAVEPAIGHLKPHHRLERCWLQGTLGDAIYLAQGDSWLSIGHFPPWATTNLLQQMVLSRSALAVNCARPGVELAHMTDTSSAQVFLNLLNGNISQRWDALLISGGGNALIDAATADPTADPKLRLLLSADEWPASPFSASGYLSKAGWATFTDHTGLVPQGLLDQRDKGKNANVPLVLHCYDYMTPRNAPAGPGLGPWLHKTVNTIYHLPPADWPAVADEFINRLGDMWLTLATTYANRNVSVIDTRGTITRAVAGTTGVSGNWENEIHPTPHGYGLLARKWRPTLDALP